MMIDAIAFAALPPLHDALFGFVRDHGHPPKKWPHIRGAAI